MGSTYLIAERSYLPISYHPSNIHKESSTLGTLQLHKHFLRLSFSYPHNDTIKTYLLTIGDFWLYIGMGRTGIEKRSPTSTNSISNRHDIVMARLRVCDPRGNWCGAKLIGQQALVPCLKMLWVV
jgi:hypothetical protein